jgi:hypothetical protein
MRPGLRSHIFIEYRQPQSAFTALPSLSKGVFLNILPLDRLLLIPAWCTELVQDSHLLIMRPYKTLIAINFTL